MFLLTLQILKLNDHFTPYIRANTLSWQFLLDPASADNAPDAIPDPSIYGFEQVSIFLISLSHNLSLSLSLFRLSHLCQSIAEHSTAHIDT